MKKLIIAGGTGFLGQALTEYFKNKMDEIVILSRNESRNEGNVTYLKWDAKTFGSWCPKLEGATAVINLCGKSVDCRYTEENKKIIFSSRLDSTKIIGEAIQKCQDPPKIWMNGASSTIYGHSENTPMTEASGKIGEGFSIEVCKAWEKMFNDFKLSSTRMINLRISLVMGNEGGVFPVLKKVVGRGLGGKMGNGRQQVNWIHVQDFCRIIEWMIDNEKAKGAYNIVAPSPVRNEKMMKLFRKKLHAWIGLPAPAWLLEIGAFFIRTETELVLKSRYAVPERLLNEGFQFKYNSFEECIENLIQSSR
ncbi:MAG: epimerase family protein [Bacteroidetes bacterium]|nr:epimerase family protein [Bacteroidota bacterium]